MDNVIIKFTAESELNNANNDLQNLKDSENDIIRAMRTLQSEYQKQNAQIQLNVKGTDNQVAALDKLRNKTEQQQKALESDLKITKKSIVDLTSQISLMDETIAGGAMNTTFRKQLRDVGDAMKILDLQFKEGKISLEDYNTSIDPLKEQYTKLVEVQDDFMDKQKEMKSDTRAFDSLIEGAELASGTMSVLMGTMGALGLETEFMEVTEKKLQSAISITMGLQAIQNTLRKESALMLGVENVQRKIGVAATNLDTSAKSKNIVVSKSATAAQWLLNKAAMANPYVLLAMAIITVVGALVIFSASSKEAEKEQSKLNNTIRDTENAINAITKDMEFDVAMAEAAGNSIKSIRDIERAALKSALSVADANTDMVLSNANATKEMKDKAIEQSKAAWDNYKKFLDRILIEDLKAKTDADKKAIEDNKKAIEDRKEAKYNAMMKGLQDEKTILEASLLQAEEGSQNELDLKIKILAKQRDIEKANKDASDADKLLSDNKYLKALDDLKKNYTQDVAKSALNIEQSNLNAKLAQAKKGSVEELNAKLDSLDNQAAAEKLAAENSIKDETERAAKIIEIDAKLTADRLAITNDFDDKQIDLRKNALLAELKLEKDALDEKVARSGESYKTNQRYRELELESIEIERKALIASYDENIDDEEEYLSKMADLKERERQLDLAGITEAEEKKKAIISKSAEIFTTLMSGYWDKQKSRIEEEQYKLDNFYTTDVEEARNNANLKLISEQELAKRKLQLRREAAQADKKQAQFQAAVDGIAAVIAAWKKGPIMAGLTAAAVLAQNIMLDSKPLPTYWKGKKANNGNNGGRFSKVGEYGPEIMWVPDNAGILPAHNSRSMADAVAAMPGFGIPIPGINDKGTPGLFIDYNKLGKAVADNIPEQKHVSVIVDKDGITTKDGSDITTSLNTKYLS